MSGIQIKGLVKRYGDIVAVNSIDLTVERGEFVTLLGPSGSGKTTTLRMVAGLEQPDSGTIEIGGRTVYSGRINVPAHKRGLGMVFQSYAMWPHKTVYENVAFPLRMNRIAKNDERSRVERMLSVVGLEHREYGTRYPSQLSGGQQQRVALARALVADPQVILYDEPLSNLDARLRDQMRTEIHRIHRSQPFTAIYVTHDQIEALALGQRIAIMRVGGLEQLGTPEEIYENPATEYVASFIGMSNRVPVEYVDGRWVTSAGPVLGAAEALPWPS